MHGDEMQLTEDRGNLLENSGIQEEEFKQSLDWSPSSHSSLQWQVLNKLESDESERGRSDAGGDGGNLSNLGEHHERYDEGPHSFPSEVRREEQENYLMKKETEIRKQIEQDMFSWTMRGGDERAQ